MRTPQPGDAKVIGIDGVEIVPQAPIEWNRDAFRELAENVAGEPKRYFVNGVECSLEEQGRYFRAALRAHGVPEEAFTRRD